MPFSSRAQARYLYANEPEVAKEFASHTKSIKALPDKVSKAVAKTSKSKKKKSTQKRRV